MEIDIRAIAISQESEISTNPELHHEIDEVGLCLIDGLKAEDFFQAQSLWRSSSISYADVATFSAFADFLSLYPEYSSAVRLGPELVGVLMAKSVGQQGLLIHMAVAHHVRRQGLGRALVERTVRKMLCGGISSWHLTVRQGNEVGLRFWQSLGWELTGWSPTYSHLLEKKVNGALASF